jgi:hypothetical protein
MDKRPQRLTKNKTDLMPKNASCKRWDTPAKILLSLVSPPLHKGWHTALVTEKYPVFT